MSTMSPQEKAISDAAIKVIVNQGFDVVSVRKVAQQAGVAPGTVQYFMGTKDELLSRALLRSAARQHERVLSLRFQSNTSPLEQLHRSLLELLPIGPIQREDAALWVILGAAASTRKVLAQEYQTELSRFQDRLISALSAADVPGDIAQTARLITAIVNGLALDYMHAKPDAETTKALSDDLSSSLQRILQK
ncbi:TetR/AcrR family transcriptional regulator [Corynebacterium amycolatum]|uniref:TetR/AcrR family transcriptional regulator n=1 Tax=Corynebacterium amycolatum TaxID=43765 RepID=UPI003EE0E374